MALHPKGRRGEHVSYIILFQNFVDYYATGWGVEVGGENRGIIKIIKLGEGVHQNLGGVEVGYHP